MPEPLSRRYSEETRTAADLYQATGDPGHIPAIVRGVFQRFAEPDLRPRLGTPCDELRLLEDLGFDSLMLIESVMVFEDIFARTVTPSELVQLKTVGDVCAYLRANVEPGVRVA